MGLEPRPTYGGYQSYDYLNSSDRPSYSLVEDYQQGDFFEIPLSDDQESRVDNLIGECPIISFHDHPLYLPSDITSDYNQYTDEGRISIGYEPLASSPLDVILVSPLAVRTWDEAIHCLGTLMADVAQQSFVTQCRTVEDIGRAQDRNGIGFVFCLETATCIEDNLDRLDVLYGLGVRSINLTYTRSNMLGSGYGEDGDGGLTAFGREAIDRMNNLGILVDASHASNQTVREACKISQDPIALTHNGAYGLYPVERLQPDDVLQTVADTGGLIGIQAGPYYTVSPDNPHHSIESVMDHFEYLVDLVGINHVTFGPDSLYGDHVALQKHFGLNLEDFPEYVERIGHVRGMDNPTESWHNIPRWLVKNGYSDEDIRKVLGGNTLRLLKEVW